MTWVLLGLALAGDAVKAVDLTWLSGTWVGTKGERVEETWTTPEAGTLLGVSRTTRGDKALFHEFLRIEERDGVLTYVALPKGAPSETPFAVVESGASWVRFENPKHDFPTSIRYERVGDELRIAVRGPDGKGFDLALARWVTSP